MAGQYDKGPLSEKLVSLMENGEYEGLGNCEFLERLGQGRLSDVYKLARHPTGEVIGAAKVRKPGLSDEMVSRFNGEADTLRRLRNKARQQNGQYVTYFPEPLYFNLQARHTDVGSFALLVLEYVETAKFFDVARHSYAQNREQFEVTCLEAARQYAEMLMVMHGINLTCADRKVDDVYWRKDRTLLVLDWNVVQEGETVRPLDLQKFGQFWFQFLVGRAPYFAGKPDRQVVVLDDPNYRDRWSELSAGSQAILRKALHPIPHCRYETAEQLREEVNAHLKRWKTSDLESLIKHGRDTSLLVRERLVWLDLAWRRTSDAYLDADRSLDFPSTDLIKTEIGDLQTQIEQSRLDLPRKLIEDRQYENAIRLLEQAIAELPYKSPERAAATRLYLYAQAMLDGLPEDPSLLNWIYSMRNPSVIGGVK